MVRASSRSKKTRASRASQHPAGDASPLNAVAPTSGVAAGAEQGRVRSDSAGGEEAGAARAAESVTDGVGSRGDAAVGDGEAAHIAEAVESLQEIALIAAEEMEFDAEGEGLVEGASGSEAGISVGDQSGDEAPQQTARCVQRAAAIQADVGISIASREDLRSDPRPKKRPEVTDEDRLSAELDTEEADVAAITDRKTNEDGVVWYLVKWAEVESEEDSFEWCTREDCAGSPLWLQLVDEYFEEKARCSDGGTTPPSFFSFINSHCIKLTMGLSEDFACVYAATRSALALLGLEGLTDEEIKRFETSRTIRRQKEKGLSWENVNQFFNVLADPKGSRNLRVAGNQYEGEYTGVTGIACAIEDPGVYLVATSRVARGGWEDIGQSARGDGTRGVVLKGRGGQLALGDSARGSSDVMGLHSL